VKAILVAVLASIAVPVLAQSPYSSQEDFSRYAMNLCAGEKKKAGVRTDLNTPISELLKYHAPAPELPRYQAPASPNGWTTDGVIHKQTFPSGYRILYREVVTPRGLKIRQIVDQGWPSKT
jgi:hypothetical protein